MSGLLFFMAASTAATAASQIAQGNATANAMDFNAAMATREAQDAANAAAVDAEKETERGERAIGAAVAAAGASGFTIGGSALNVLGDLSSQHRYNTREIIYGGELERRRLLSQAAGFRAEGQAAKQNGMLGAIGTVMSGGYRMRQTQLDRRGGTTTTTTKPRTTRTVPSSPPKGGR